MKTLKKLFSVSAIVALLGTLAPMYAFGATYSDELQDAYKYAYAHEVTTMKSIDDANMYGNLTRIALAKMIANYAINVLGMTPDTTKTCTFPDVPAALDAKYDNGVTKACQLGLMGVGIDNFNPNGIVTRAEFGTAFSRALNHDSEDLEDMNKATPYYKKHLEFLKANDIMTKIDNPNQVEVRGYVMLMMMRADDSYSPSTVEGCTAEELLKCITADDYDACIAACSNAEEPEEETVNPGYITVKKEGSVATETVAKNAVNKKVGSVKLTAGENDSTVTALTVKVDGLGTDTVNVKLAKDGVVVSADKKVSTNSKTATIRLNSNMVVKAGKSETLDIIASLEGGAGNEYTFSVTDVTVVNGESAGLPVTLGGLRTSNYSIAKLTSGDVVFTPTSSDLNAGKTQEQILTLTVTPSVDATLNGFTVVRDGDIDLTEAFDDVKLYKNNTAIATATITKDRISFDGLSIDSVDSEAINLVVKGDVIYVGSGKSFTLKINKNEINIIESSSSESMPTEEITSTQNVTVKGADFEIVKLTKENLTVAPGSSNVVLFNAKLTSAVDFDVTNYTISSDTALTTGVFSRVTVYVDNIPYVWLDSNGIGDEASSTNGTTITFNKEDYNFSVSSSHSATVKVVANIKNTVDSYSGYRLTLQVDGLKNPNETTSFTVDQHETCHSVTVSNGSYTISQPTTMPTNKTVVAGENEDVLYFNLKASAEDLMLTGVTISADKGFTGFATSVSLMRGTKTVKTINKESELSGTTLLFKDLNETLTKDESVAFTVRIAVKNDDVQALGTKFQLSTVSMGVVRSKNTNVSANTTSTQIAGTEYAISSSKPTVEFGDRNNEYTPITIKNASSYDLLLSGITLVITNNDKQTNWTGIPVNFLSAMNSTNSTATWNSGSAAVPAVQAEITCTSTGGYSISGTNTGYTYSGSTDSGDVTLTLTEYTRDYGNLKATQITGSELTNMPAEFMGLTGISCSLTKTGADEIPAVAAYCSNPAYTTQDACEGSNLVASGTAPGKVTITLPSNTYVDNAGLTRYVELASTTYTFGNNDYSVKIQDLTYQFVDKTDSSKKSAPITETYNISK